jgi:hypothetical protein
VISDGGERVGVRACEARDRYRGTAGRKRRGGGEEAVEIRAHEDGMNGGDDVQHTYLDGTLQGRVFVT